MKKKPLKSLKLIINTLKNKDTLSCWMYSSNFVGYICGKIAKVRKINFGIRHSSINKKIDKRLTICLNKIGARMSYKVDNVIYNGILAKENHEKIGYDKTKSIVIENGCDIEFYQYNKKAKEILEKQILGLNKNYIWIISACRYNKIKDIPTFLKAIKMVKKQYSNIQVIMCGIGIEESNVKLVQEINRENLVVGQDIFLEGLVKNLPDYFSACDIYVLHSASEAFPNTLIEAMSCEIECITTKVGDVDNIFPNKEHVIEPQNFEELANKLLDIVKEKAVKRRKDYRELVIQKYSIQNVIKEYENYN